MAPILKVIALLFVVGLATADVLLFETTTVKEVENNVEEIANVLLGTSFLDEYIDEPRFSNVGVFNWRTGNEELLSAINHILTSFFRTDFEESYFK